MNRVLFTSLKIDYYSAINCFIYYLNKIEILDNIFHSLYRKKGFKFFITVLASIMSLLKEVASKSIYVLIIYFISKNISDNIIITFIHIYFIFSIIGMFINTKLLNISYKHYINTCILRMNTKDFLLSHLIFNLLINLLINILVLSFLVIDFKENYIFIFMLSLFSLFSKVVGELINLKYYQIKHTYLIDNYVLYFGILILLILISFLPYFNIFISSSIYIIVIFIFFVLFLYSIYKLLKFEDYTSIVREIINERVLNQTQKNDKQCIKFENSKTMNLNNKTIYQKFNSIFFMRHRKMLLKSLLYLSLLITLGSIIYIYYLVNNKELIDFTREFIKKHVVLLIPIMYFINQGALIIQIMFSNSDRALLNYKFYRNYDVILGLFKERLKLIVKINLIPAGIIGVMLAIIFNISNIVSWYYIILLISCTMLLSIFFSVHYLTMYYLFQPYNEDIKIVNAGYLMANFILSMICFILIGFNINISIEFLFGIVLISTILYIIISFALVSRRGIYTFRIR